MMPNSLVPNRRRGLSYKKLRGMTLVELMVTVSIGGVLATLGSVSFREQVNKSHSVEAVAMLGTMRQAVSVAGIESGNADIDLNFARTTFGNGNGKGKGNGNNGNGSNGGGIDGDGNNGHGNNPDGCDPDNPGNGGKCSGASTPSDSGNSSGNGNNGNGNNGNGSNKGGGLDGDGNNGHGNNPDGCDPDNPGNGGKCSDASTPSDSGSNGNGSENGSSGSENGNTGNGNENSNENGDADSDNNGNGSNQGGGIDGDGNNGHGNNPDRCDPDNPGNGGQCDDDDGDGSSTDGPDSDDGDSTGIPGGTSKGIQSLCDSASPVPESLESVRGKVYNAPASAWASGTSGAGWSCLRLSRSGNQRYQFGYDKGAGNSSEAEEGFTAWARGDLDGDGHTSLFRVRGDLVNGRIVHSAGVEVVDGTE